MHFRENIEILYTRGTFLPFRTWIRIHIPSPSYPGSLKHLNPKSATQKEKKIPPKIVL
jgi:hypothetical protein